MTTTTTGFATRIRSLIDENLDELIEIRHDLHAHPELGYNEHRTSEVVQRELNLAKVAFKAGMADGTGVLGYLPGQADTSIGLRADMDALPITEETGKPYASTTPGTMHACGHDGHTTILIGAARVLARLASEGELPNPVLFTFQPAEEGGGGGRKMVDDGCLRGEAIGVPVRHMFGLHGWPQMELGNIGTRPGPMLAAADKFVIHIRGRGGHAAFPHTSTDPVVCTATIISALQSIASRNTDPLDSVVVSVTQMNAGTSFNIIPETATLGGTVRTLRPEVKAATVTRMREIVEHTTAAYGCRGELVYEDGYPVTRNDPVAVSIFERHALEAVGDTRLDPLPTPVMGAEDFSFYCQEVPSCFFALGLTAGLDPARQIPGLHHPRFDFNDKAIALGVEMFCRLAIGA